MVNTVSAVPPRHFRFKSDTGGKGGGGVRGARGEEEEEEEGASEALLFRLHGIKNNFIPSASPFVAYVISRSFIRPFCPWERLLFVTAKDVTIVGVSQLYGAS